MAFDRCACGMAGNRHHALLYFFILVVVMFFGYKLMLVQIGLPFYLSLTWLLYCSLILLYIL